MRASGMPFNSNAFRLYLAGLCLSSVLIVGSLEAEPAGLSPVTWPCVVRVSEEMNVPVALILSIMDAEDGRVGRVSGNKNGSYDIGPMQINSWWLPLISLAGVSEENLLNDGCVNVAVAGWLLRELLDKHKSPEAAIALYHSLDPYYGRRYLHSVLKKALKLDVNRVLLKANETVPGRLYGEDE